MVISLIWFYFGRRQLRGIGAPPAEAPGLQRVAYVVIGSLVAIPVVYALLALGAGMLQWVLTAIVRRPVDSAAPSRESAGARWSATRPSQC